ncbi:MAG: thiamine pyrophosphate-dependent dehydrogenase E1 component subunit alpha [Candidatus Methanomethylicia archaeon]
MKIPTDIKIRLYREMIKSRYLEEELLKLYKEGTVPGTLHLSIGQEAVSAGVITALEPEDLIVGTHRSISHALIKGVEPGKIIAEILGRKTGCCKGMGGQMHLSDPSKGLMLTSAIVAANVPIASGIGYAIKYLKQNRIIVAFIGDGAVNNADFHEGLNLASIWRVPLLVVIENNQYAISVSIKKSTRVEKLSDKAIAYGIKGYTVDGMNVFEVYIKTKELVDDIRKGEGPILLEALTYRFLGHYAGDVIQPYRTKEEIEEWKKKDPIVQAENILLKENVLTNAEIMKIKEEVMQEIKNAINFALSSPYPEPEALYSNVW